MLDTLTHDMAMLPSYLIMGLSVAFVAYLVISASMAVRKAKRAMEDWDESRG